MHHTHPTDASARPAHIPQQRENLFSRSSRRFMGVPWLCRLVLVLLFVLLPMLATSASAAPQFTTLIIGSGSYNATQDQSGSGWTWTASTNTLDFPYDYSNGYTYLDEITNGNIAFGTSNSAAVATIDIRCDRFINGNISCQGTLLVNVTANCNIFKVNGTLAGSLSVAGGINVGVSISNDITGNLSMDGGTVKVGGKVGGNLTVSGGVVTINGTVGGRNITGGIVKVNGSFIAGAPPAITASTTIPLNTLTLGVPASGNGWRFDPNDYYGGEILYIEGSLINYTLTGAAPDGIAVEVADTVNGSLTLDGVTINTADTYGADSLSINGSNLTVYIKNNNTLIGATRGICNFSSGVFTLDTAAGSSLTVSGSKEVGIECANDLVLQGSGTFNFYCSNSDGDRQADEAIWVGGDLLLQDSVTVNATAGDNYTGISPDSCGWNNGLTCWGDITIAGNAKLNATGGSAFGAGCKAGNGISCSSKLTVTSTAANALVATGGVGAVADPLYGNGISAWFYLQIAGTGSIKAVGDNAFASAHDITIAGCKITAEASGAANYALHAGGYNGTNYAGGTVFITGGTTTASNITTPANIYYKTLNKTGGILNGDSVNPNPNPNPDPKNSGGGGGGGAPSLLYLVAVVALMGTRLVRVARATRP